MSAVDPTQTLTCRVPGIASTPRLGSKAERMLKFIFAAFSLVGAVSSASAQGLSSNDGAVPVTVDNFARAESDNYFAANAKEAGGLGKLSHRREPASIDGQTVIRLNRDTLYSFGVFDLTAGRVTITLPDAGERFMSLMVINEDNYISFVEYDSKPRKGPRILSGICNRSVEFRIGMRNFCSSQKANFPSQKC